MLSCQAIETSDETPDVATALCRELRLPLDHLLERLERANRALQARTAAIGDGATLQALRALADAHSTTRHLLRVVEERLDAGRMRRLDVRGVVRAAVAMTPELDVAVDAPEAAFVDGVDSRLVHAFAALLAEAATDDAALVARIGRSGDEIVVDFCYDDGSARDGSVGPRGPHAIDRSVVRHIIAAHGGRIERWPQAGRGVAVRVTLGAASMTPE
jgi:hypothetical protein